MQNIIIDNTELVSILSPARLSSYKNEAEATDELLAKYAYNIKVSEAFYPVLALFEIVLRNKICSAIEKLIKPNWLIAELEKQSILRNEEYQKLIEAKEHLIKNNKKITNDRLIAEMTFGFWVYLFTKAYKPRLWDKKHFFETVFPNYKTNKELVNLTLLQDDLRTILRLRNRIFHHEIITNGRITPMQNYQIILNLIHLMSDDAVKYLNQISRFEAIISQKP